MRRKLHVLGQLHVRANPEEGPLMAILGATYGFNASLLCASDLERECAILQAGVLGTVVDQGTSKIACARAVELGHLCSKHLEQALMRCIVSMAQGN